MLCWLQMTIQQAKRVGFFHEVFYSCTCSVCVLFTFHLTLQTQQHVIIDHLHMLPVFSHTCVISMQLKCIMTLKWFTLHSEISIILVPEVNWWVLSSFQAHQFLFSVICHHFSHSHCGIFQIYINIPVFCHFAYSYGRT